MTRIDKLLADLKAMKGTKPILCRTPDGAEMAMSIIDALRTGSTFIRALDGCHDYDELYKALLSGDDDIYGLPEVE